MLLISLIVRLTILITTDSLLHFHRNGPRAPRQTKTSKRDNKTAKPGVRSQKPAAKEARARFQPRISCARGCLAAFCTVTWYSSITDYITINTYLWSLLTRAACSMIPYVQSKLLSIRTKGTKNTFTSQVIFWAAQLLTVVSMYSRTHHYLLSSAAWFAYRKGCHFGTWCSTESSSLPSVRRNGKAKKSVCCGNAALLLSFSGWGSGATGTFCAQVRKEQKKRWKDSYPRAITDNQIDWRRGVLKRTKQTVQSISTHRTAFRNYRYSTVYW